MRLSALHAALMLLQCDCSVDKSRILPDDVLTSVLENIPEDLNIFAASKPLSQFRRAALLPLNKEQSRRYIANEDGFQDVVIASRANPRKQVRLNLGEDFRKYMVDAEFRATVNDLVENDLEQVWSDVERLNLTGAQVADIGPLAGLKNLKQLGLAGTQVFNITPLAGLKNLEVLNLSFTQVTDVSPLAGLEKLSWLKLSPTQVTNTSSLSHLRGLVIHRF